MTEHATTRPEPDPAAADLSAALMKAYLSGNGAEVERVMTLMAQAGVGMPVSAPVCRKIQLRNAGLSIAQKAPGSFTNARFR